MPQSTRLRRGRIPLRTLAALSAASLIGATLTAAAAPPATAGPPAKATGSAVVSGNARFEVLSPTLIRTEYAGDAAFLDASTVNAVGRDGFAKTKFRSTTAGGWLTIDTGALRLRYKTGSGPFTAKNLTLSLWAGRQFVAASPWASEEPPSCVVGALCEAEALQLTGATLATDHGGFTGRGFAAGFQSTGSMISFGVEVATAGAYQLHARYANATGGDGQYTNRTLSVSVDGGATKTLTLPPTGNWDTWGRANVALDLPVGAHTVTVHRTATDSGNVNIDSLAVVTEGAEFPAPVPPAAVPCAFGSPCEADTGTLVGGAVAMNNHSGHSGEGFVANLLKADSADTVTVTGVPAAGTYQLQLRYSNGLAPGQPLQPRKVLVRVGSADPTEATLAPTSSWEEWRTTSVPVTLAAGDNTVAIGCPDGGCHVNLDTIAVTRTDTPLLAPHAPLGGYRRSLDGADGGAVTIPGLLYQDGWSLLVDTQAGVFDTRTHAVTERPSHGGKPYQDGYVFGYGQDYKRALRDLTALTGPSMLLPRWAYGVWYSEYYDRTAADYQNTIVPRFRAEGVPLDVLVVDTDFKALDTWNGWEIDTNKFPDPTAFFAWARSQGLHNTLNIHPSVKESDPQFAKAQEIAKGKLKKGGCAGCYLFDFGDPDQLAAYMALHQPMSAQGVDFWWLDWCCDNSESTKPGITGDAWINQQYADDASTRIGRGFAFSRTYGSLQAGGYSGYSGPKGVAPGPWADKRSTLHFTGDAISNWATLRYEVGYTGSESVATGMASISHDIGGHTRGLQEPGSEPRSTKLPDDLYARWVQFGTFQPIDRLHSDHSDRLPWQYGPAAKKSATTFLNLRENLVPYTYTLAKEAATTGLPIVRPLYLEYPGTQEAYATAGAEYLYGSDVLVAPVTDPGSTATTTVWFPPGDTWTDYFTGVTYQGGTTHQVTTGLDTMPVFVKSGGMMTTRTKNVTNDEQNPLTDVTLTVAEGANGTFSLYEDDGTTTDLSQRGTTRIDYSRTGKTRRVTVKPVSGTFKGQVQQRAWTVSFRNATAPTVVSINGRKVSAANWMWDSATSTLTVRAPGQSTHRTLTVQYR